MKAFCISGFLGLATDWDFLENSSLSYSSHSACEFLSSDFAQAAKKINDKALSENCDFLMGYSLGSRLALHALLQSPKQWTGAFIISAHPGLTHVKDKLERQANDGLWAHGFLSLPWEEIILRWNEQSVLRGDSNVRREEDFDRGELAGLLTNFSLGRQEDLREKLRELQLPVTFITGRRDEKFTALADEIVGQNPLFKTLVVNSGHRVLVEAPDEVLSALSKPVATCDFSV